MALRPLFSFAFVLALMLVRPAWAADTDELARQLQAMQQIVSSLDARLAKLENVTQQNQPLLGMLQEVEALKSEVAKLRGQAEVQVHQMDTLGKRQNDLYVDLDQRVTDLAKSLKPASTAGVGVPEVAPTQPAPAAVAASPSGPVAAPSAPQLDPMMESRSYEASLDHFRGANYAGAIAGFKGFLKAYPDSTLASNAQYWIGYSYYALKDYKSSLAHQQKLVAVYPTSAKVPDALLNIASSMIALDDLTGARKVLEELVAKYPGTNAANLATRRLSALK
ncbi:MAG: tol-pal system protein YbgF [Sulfuriferula multivorans]|uniref:Cell division coordinator CpoB n=1 Tax=Sulfuriferula multivorans TaxID=1559896 RepID=A0A7C9P577_9PROT|nr:tol-pal system protein YbgF [Sulfuriferula multivorans]